MRMVLFQPSDQLLYMGGATSSMTPYRTTIYIRPALLQNSFQSLKGFEGKKLNILVFWFTRCFEICMNKIKKFKKNKKVKRKEKKKLCFKTKKEQEQKQINKKLKILGPRPRRPRNHYF